MSTEPAAAVFHKRIAELGAAAGRLRDAPPLVLRVDSDDLSELDGRLLRVGPVDLDALPSVWIGPRWYSTRELRGRLLRSACHIGRGSGWIELEEGEWDAGLPLPLTVGHAVALVKRDAVELAELWAEDLAGAVLALVHPEAQKVVGARAAELAEEWAPPAGLLRWLFDAVYGPSYLLGPVGVYLAAADARGALEAERDAFEEWHKRGGAVRAVPFSSALLLYRAEREALPRLHAARDAFLAVRRLAAALDAGGPFAAAVTVELEEAAARNPPDDTARAALADEGRRGQFAGELLALARTVARDLFEGEPPDDGARVTVATDAGPALRWDAAFADVLAKVGARGRELAEEQRKKSAERMAAATAEPAGALWVLWFELDATPGDPPRWLRRLARALWADVWRPPLRRELRPVALSIAGLAGVTGALAGRRVEAGADGRGVLVNREGRAVARFGREGPHLATAVQAEALDALAVAGVGHLATVAAARFVPWFAHAVQRRAKEEAPLVFEGADGVNAYGTVAVALGLDGEKDAGMVRGLLHALNCALLSYPDGSETSVLMLDYQPGGGRGNPSRLTLTPGRPWLSSAVFQLPPAYRILAPVPLLPDLAPPFVGNRQDRAALARLYLRILAELAREAPDIARGMGARIPGDRWAELAVEEGLRNPGPLALDPIRDRWTQDGDDGPAVFERVGLDRWHLAPAFAEERRMLEEGGKHRIGASEGGRRAAKAKAEAKERLADGRGRRGGGRGRP